MGYQVFICCYFDQEDRNWVGVHILFTLFHSDFAVFVVNFRQISRGRLVSGMSLVQEASGEKVFSSV
jgi:hypothetical protein